MTLRTRTFAALALTFASLMAVVPWVTSGAMQDSYRSLEDDEAKRNVRRVLDAFDRETRQLASISADWAFWDDAHRFVQGRDGHFRDTNLHDGTFDSLDLDLIAWFDRRGRPIFAGERPAPGASPRVWDEDLRVAVTRMVRESPPKVVEDSRTGMTALADGLWLVSIRPVLPSDKAGDAAGTMVFARKVDQRFAAALAAVTHTRVLITPYAAASARPGARLPAAGALRIGPPEADRLPAKAVIGDLDGRAVASLDLSTDRAIHAVGERTRSMVVGTLVAVCALFWVVTMLCVDRGVLRGVAHLTDAVSRLGRIGAAGGRLAVNGGDELSTLAARINHMLDDLEVAEAARSASDRRLALALDAANDGWFDWDLVGGSVYFSPRWCTMLGFAVEEIGDSPRAALVLTHADDRQSLIERVREHLDGRSASFALELRMRTSTGEWRWFLARGRVVERDDAGAPLRLVGTQTDISDRKEMEARMVLTDRLASVGTLAAGVAHEVNNPLAFVISNLEYASGQLRGIQAMAEVREALVEAGEGAQRVRTIVRDMRRFTRMEDEVRGPVDLRRVIGLAVRMTVHELRGRATVIDEVGDDVPVCGSEARLGQVIINLLVNAAQAMPEGRAADANSIHIRASRCGPEMMIVVEDNGRGMDGAVLRRVFDPFFTTKAQGVGTGLGLYICHTLVTSFGGRIDISSTVGEGSNVRLRLPIWQDDALPVTLALPPASLREEAAA